MYAIIETYNNERNLVKIIDTKKDFLNYVQTTVPNDYSLVSNIKFSDFEINSLFKNNRYLLANEDNIIYLEKKTKVEVGYLYNTSKEEIIKIREWELINNKIKPTISDLFTDTIESD